MWKFVYSSIVVIVPMSIAYAQNEAYNTTPEIPALDLAHVNSEQVSDDLTSLYLLVYLNHTDTSEVVEFLQDTHAQLFTKAKNLKKLRIKLKDNINDEEVISLSSIQGLKYQYTPEKQELYLDIPNLKLDSYSIDLKGQDVTPTELLNFKPLTSALVNYAIYNTNTNGKNNLSASFDTRLSSRYGNVLNSFIYNDNNTLYRDSEKFIRLESSWQYIDPIKIRAYTLGDFISNTTEWGNSVRLAGLQWSSAYKQRSDIITAALPQFSGSAALPSSLDLFINQQKIYSGEVPSGPFDIKSLPFITGNEVTLITKDATGQQVKTRQSYYYSQNVLAKGINQFSVDIGIPRFNYGIESNNYDDNVVFGSGSIRYGLTNKFTVNSNIESTTDGLSNIGLGFATKLFNRGVLNFDLAGSHYKNQDGGLALVGLEGRITQDLNFNASYQTTIDNYYNLARVANVRYKKQMHEQDSAQYDLLSYSALADAIIKFGLNWNFYSGYNLSANYNKLKYTDNRYEAASLNLGGAISKHLSFYATGFKDLNESNNYGAYLTLVYTPTPKLISTVSYANESGSSSYRAQVASANSQTIGDFGWGAAYEHSDRQSDYKNAYVNYLSRPALLSASYSRTGQNDQTVISATGALVAASGRIFAANEIGDSFAIVENAGPRSHIMNGGVDLGPTDANGRFLISNLSPYSKHSIFLDPTNLALDWLPESTQKTVVTGYNQGSKIDFSTHKSITATVILQDKNQQPIPAGYSAQINSDSNSTAIVGYGGEVYLTDLKPQNTLIVDLLDHGSCRVEFNYSSNQASTQKIGPFICQ